ncbi:MAG: tetratricopeptide repeat protein [Cyanobacteria bacterium SIG26]|nr:tetratricopeptide repeat protein [Cyanobacteria bacterium SIG26]
MSKEIIKLVTLLILLGLGFGFAKLYQPAEKTINIYKNALTDYNKENYSNSYYLFSKVGYLSPLKPFAVYNQALSARALGDRQSELDRYQLLVKFYPNNKLSQEALYMAARLLIEQNPKLAYKYFEKVTKSNLDNDYKIAAEYFKTKILLSHLKNSKNSLSQDKFTNVENVYRAYLEHAPSGRLAVSVADDWVDFNSNLSSKDSVLVAKVYNLAGMYEKADEILLKSTMNDSWVIKSINLYSKRDYSDANSLVEDGVANYSSSSITREDYKAAVDLYIDNSMLGKNAAILKLNNLANGLYKDYLLHKKCEIVENKDKYSCYTSLYQIYPTGEFAQDALYQMINLSVRVNDFQNARVLIQDFMHKFPKSKYCPQIVFWLAKMEQQVFHNANFVKYYQDVVNNYPDSYYAYRSFWLLNKINSATINAKLEYKPVIYPYKYPSKNDVLYILLSVNDLDMVGRYTNDDFIKSWIEYEKGNYTKSMVIAREAMDKLEEKPQKSDLRWRLVYPQNYYKQVKKYANEYNNAEALIMAIVREESSFNPRAQSPVGAMGLMQLMPSTAHEVGNQSGIDFNTNYLFNPELNIRLGNIYYATLRSMLDNKDVSSVAAYNGGIGSVIRWRATLLYNDTDDFVEQIPYDETKNYVKKVFRSYWNYIRIYQN